LSYIRGQDRARLISRDGNDWARQFPRIVASVLKLRRKQFVLDGEVVVLDKIADFDAVASRKHDKRAQFYAFDLLAGNGEDQRKLPLSVRKSNLAQLLSRPVDGIFIAEYEQGDIGHDLFRVLGPEYLALDRQHDLLEPPHVLRKR
jgi:bifunctional non-homologous end joining protein LigD